MRCLFLLLALYCCPSGHAFGFFKDLFGKRQGQDERRGIYYEVKRGDTLYSLSRRFEVSVDQIKRANRLKGNNLPLGKIFIPGAKDTGVKIVKPATPTVKKLPPPQVVKSQPKATAPIAKSLPAAKKPAPKSSKARQFMWPVKAPVLASNGKFGTRTDGLSNSGIKLAVPNKEPILASRDGKVVYSGTMAGYGETIILDHLDNYFTVYAHMDSVRDLKSGFTVSAGSVIGYGGTSGRVAKPTLHFEIRKLNQAVDPLSLLDSSRLAMR